MRIIFLVDMDCFFAQIEEKANPRFKGHPLVVGAEPNHGKGRGVVSTANYEARKYGIHSALPISEAYRLCPQAIFLPVNMRLYEKVSEKIMDIIRGVAPLTEQVSLDEAYGDISFCKTYQEARVLAQKVKDEIFAKEGLIATVGVGPNKMIAKMACTKAKPNGLLLVEPKGVESFLNPLNIKEIPGIGPKTALRLQNFVKKSAMSVEDLKKMEKQDLIDLLGILGGELYQRARGIDETPIVSEREIKSISKEHTFEKDTTDPEVFLPIFEGLIASVFAELKSQNFSAKTVTIIVRFKGFETHTKAKTLETFSQDIEVFKKEAMLLLLRSIVGNFKPLRLLGVRLSHLEYAPKFL